MDLDDRLSNAARAPRLGLGRQAILGLITAASLVIALEGAVRLSGIADEPAHFVGEVVAGRAFVHADPEVGFDLVPGFSNHLYRINARGFRGDDLPRDATERTAVLCVGDSTTFGWLVPQGDEFPAALQRDLDGRDTGGQRFDVVNAGVPSYTSAQVLRKIRRVLAQQRPSVVVLMMPWNDVWYSAIHPWRPEVQVPQLPAPWQTWFLRHVAVFRLAAQGGIARPARDRSSGEALEAFARNIEESIDRIRAAGAVAVLLEPPFSVSRIAGGDIRFRPTGLLWQRDFVLSTARRYATRFRAVAINRGVPLVENPLFMADAASDDLFVDELHPNRAGYERMARPLGDRLVAINSGS
jgi:lysophospholipase L1-like esterase